MALVTPMTVLENTKRTKKQMKHEHRRKRKMTSVLRVREVKTFRLTGDFVWLFNTFSCVTSQGGYVLPVTSDPNLFRNSVCISNTQERKQISNTCQQKRVITRNTSSNQQQFKNDPINIS